jgi:hypothetical protein
MLWTFPVADGDYDVRLYMKSGWNGADAIGDRQFDVEIEGALVLDDYDLVADAGHRVGTMKSFNVTVTDGNLNIDFLHGPIQNPLVNAIEIIDVTEPGAPEALVEITPNGGLNASTYGNDSYQITNNSTGGITIDSVEIDLSTGILPDMVFDPTGSGGDATSNCLTPNTGATAVGFIAPSDPCVDPYSQPRNGGFDILTVDFNEFDPGEFFAFTTDIDPNSIQGVSGAGNAGAVSGYELIGATITVTFSDGSVITSSLYEDGSLGGSQAIVAPAAPAAPTIDVVGVTTPATVSDPNQTILVTGAPGANVSLLQMDTRLYIASGDPPFNVTDPTYYANEAMSGKTLYTAVIESDGDVEIPVTLLQTLSGDTTPDGGLNYFIAVLSDGPYAVDQQVSMTSNVEILKYDPTANSAPIIDAIADQTMEEGGDLSLTFNITDADGDTLTIGTSSAPDASSFYTETVVENAPGDYTVTLDFAPETGDAGSYDVTVTADDGTDASTEPFTLTVTEPAAPIAHVEINPGAGLSSSTFNGGFIIENDSTLGLTIDSVSFDLSTAIYPNMVFDPNGAAGDAVGKCFTPVSGGTQTGVVAPADPCADPFSAPRGNGGYDIITVDFSDFNPGESFEFAVDVDPTSIENASTTGSSGSVSGLELAGSTVTITFSDGSVLTTELYRIPASNGGSQNDAAADPLAAAPGLQIVGLPATPTDAVVASANQTAEISGPAGADVALMVIESDLLTDNTIPDPFEANQAQAIDEYFDAIGAGGTVQIPVTLNDTASGDLYYIVAVIEEPDGRTSPLSQVWRLELDPTAATADLTGSFTMQGRSDYGVDLTVDVYEVGQTTPAYSFTPTATSGGEFTVTGIVPGTYEIAVKHSNTLQVVETATLTAGSNTADFGELLAGDANDDNVVSALDFSILAGAYNSEAGDANYDARADFNGDGFVTGLDFSLLAGNFNVAGEDPSG